MQNRLTIFIPIETKARELPYKSPLAFLLAYLGCKVLIGRQQELRLLLFKKRNFFYLDKSCAKTKYQLYKDIKKLGGVIGVFCEEGLVYRSKDQYLSERIFQKSFDLIDVFWCWGKNQFLDISEKYDKSKLKIIDSPRLSITYKYKTTYSDKKPKKTKVLFLTSFGRLDKRINNKKVTQIEILKKRGTFNTEIGEKFYMDWDNYLKKYQEKFINLIETFCKNFPNIQFEIRIHPSESKDKYLKLIKKYNNLDFSNFLQIGESIINASHVVSSFSTSSIEAHLINCNSYVFNPDSDERYEPKIIKDICNCYNDPNEIINQIKINKDNTLTNNSYKFYLSDRCDNHISILKTYAEEINEIALSTLNKKTKNFSLIIKIKYFFKHNIRNLLYLLGLKKDSLLVNSKCNFISSEDIIKYGEEFLSTDNQFSNIQKVFGIKKISNNVFEVSKL